MVRKRCWCCGAIATAEFRLVNELGKVLRQVPVCRSCADDVQRPRPVGLAETWGRERRRP